MAKKKSNKKSSKSKNQNVKSEKIVKTDFNETKLKNNLNKQKTIEKAKRQLHYETSGSNELMNLFKVVLIVTGIMLVFYGITVIATKKADEVTNNNEEKVKTEIQYENLMIGAMLNMDGTYYVLIEEEKDNRLGEYETLVQTIKANEDADKIYYAKLNDIFNSDYLGKEKNYSSDMTKFKVTGTTLIKIKDHKIDDTYDSYESIKSKLQDLD